MSKLTKAIALVMLAFWGLATTHCLLEQVPGLEFLSCCQHGEAAPHQDKDCTQDSCATVESGFYKVDEQPASVPAPLLVLSFLLPCWEPVALATPPGLAISCDAPPELARVWQFSSRTALPPRAPSIGS